MRFAAIDFETANSCRSSICAAGVAIFEDGNLLDKKTWLISPFPNEFEEFNISLHGISPEDVAGKPSFPTAWQSIEQFIAGCSLVIAHNAQFDMNCLRNAMNAHSSPYPIINYACTRVLAQKVIPGLHSYGLVPVVNHLLGNDFTFNHHDPESDAICAGNIFIELIKRSKKDPLTIWSEYGIQVGKFTEYDYVPCGLKRNIHPKYIQEINENADTENAFYGRTVAFTGALQSMKRSDAFKAVNECGGIIDKGVTHNTNYLVVGNYTHAQLKEALMSSKLSKAYSLIKEGQELEIITEDDFLWIISN